MIEVLAPAGSPETFKAAVRAGADAVYFGMGTFNARRNAKNFTEDDVRSAVSYARIRGVKTYLTLNTLAADSELSAALNTAKIAASCGVDALIVQDIGLIRILRKHLPAMPLHASTQMSVHSPEALDSMAEMGFKRVVIARETDKVTMALICKRAKELNIEIEAFVHGALCMCLSGQCYLSSVLGGRSGNRGLCAQPCRLAFSVENGTGHDLSLKDMSLVEHIKEMADMGVTSFKIEGRMKRPEYVASAVSVCRAAADEEPVNPKFQSLLSGIFSRSGHTDGYYSGNLGKNMFGIRTETDEKLSAKLINSAHEIYRRERQNIKLNCEINVKKNTPLNLIISDGVNSVSAKGEIPEKAENVSVSENFIKSKLSKCGGTCYYFDRINVNLDDGLCVSGSELSFLRKQAFEKLEYKRSLPQNHLLKDESVSYFKNPKYAEGCKSPCAVAYFRSAAQMPSCFDGLSAVVLPAEEDFSKISVPENIVLLASLPRGVVKKGPFLTDCLKKAKKYGVSAVLCGNFASFKIARDAALPAIADFGMNIYNSKSIEEAKDLGAKAAVISFELSLSSAVRLSPALPKGIISYGRLPLMIFRNCPGKNGHSCAECKGICSLTDRKGILFPVMCRGEFSEMFNSRPLWMADRLNELKGLDFHILYFTDESKERCEQIIKSSVKRLAPDVEFTRGLYYREVF